MSEISVIAHVHAVAGARDTVRARLETLATASRHDAGCLEYTLHQHADDPDHFVLIERWASREQWLDHMKTPHTHNFAQATDGRIHASAVHELRTLGIGTCSTDSAS